MENRTERHLGEVLSVASDLIEKLHLIAFDELLYAPNKTRREITELSEKWKKARQLAGEHMETLSTTGRQTVHSDAIDHPRPKKYYIF